VWQRGRIRKRDTMTNLINWGGFAFGEKRRKGEGGGKGEDTTNKKRVSLARMKK